ncbi:MAG: hypothetical protein LBM93_02950 [Oscillospiraceae bacterium]|jgi:proteasome lid subunit RPN8/RPN11|nr:hypothetical protein [Oscillospiraceae bacterium]
MKIVIHSVNNTANQEILSKYNEKLLICGNVHLSDNFASADNTHKLILENTAVCEIFDFIEWNIGQRPDSRDEQGGILLGKRYYDEEQDIHFVIVSKVITAIGALESSGYLDITHECWCDMHQRKDAYNEETGEELVIVGWFHTHPNMLSCFMSGTDRNTQNLFFNSENTYSIVINPQRHLLKAFRAKECHPTQAFLIVNDVTTEDN